MNYFLTTERLGFRHWSQDDFDLARVLWGDIEVTRLIGGPFNDERIREKLSKEIASQSQHGIQYWPIFERESNNFVGCCGLRPYEKATDTLELGFHLRPCYWGKGIAQEAARAAIDFAFATLSAKALFSGHNPNNEPSRRLLKKLGFEYIRDEYYQPTGLNHPSYLLGRESWATSGR